MKHKILPGAPSPAYEFVYNFRKIIQFTPDGRFFIEGDPSDDYEALGKKIQEWVLYYNEGQGWIKRIEFDCDCGAEKSKTTHVNWCSTNKG